MERNLKPARHVLGGGTVCHEIILLWGIRNDRRIGHYSEKNPFYPHDRKGVGLVLCSINFWLYSLKFWQFLTVFTHGLSMANLSHVARGDVYAVRMGPKIIGPIIAIIGLFLPLVARFF